MLFSYTDKQLNNLNGDTAVYSVNLSLLGENIRSLLLINLILSQLVTKPTP